MNLTAHILDGPISEAVISKLTLPDVADKVLKEMTDEYEQAKKRAASYRREKRRLETEVENLRGNLAMSIMSADQLKWLNQEIQQRLADLRELADLESQPIGAAVGRPVPGKEDIELVKELLETLGEKWDDKPNGLKNALLRLLLDRVVIWHEPATIRAKLIWRTGDERQLLIQRPHKKKRRPWTEIELEVLREHYETASRDELAAMLPNRSWKAIRTKGAKLGLSGRIRRPPGGVPYTPEEDELIKCYYAGEISQEEVLSATGRTQKAIWSRAWVLGLTWQPRRATWDWLDDEGLISQREGSPRSRPG